jgi:hypothetical protein
MRCISQPRKQESGKKETDVKARALAQVALDVTLVDLHNYYLFQPLRV